MYNAFQNILFGGTTAHGTSYTSTKNHPTYFTFEEHPYIVMLKYYEYYSTS